MIAKGKRLTAWVLFLALLLSAVTAFAGEKSAEEGTSAENLRQEESAQDKEQKEDAAQEESVSAGEQQEGSGQEENARAGEQKEDSGQEENACTGEQQEESVQMEVPQEEEGQNTGAEDGSADRSSAPARAAAYTIEKTVTDVLGIKADAYLSYVKKYTAAGNSYYLGTPYPTQAQANQYGGGIYDFRSPNGDKWQGFALMQCTGFVWHVLVGAGAQGAQTPHMSLRSSYYTRRPYETSGWYSWMIRNKISYHDYSNKSDMLKSGTLDYGDIIWIWDESTGGSGSVSNYHHIGIYIGDGTSDKMWHSIEGKGNIISEIVGKASRVSFTVVDTTSEGKLKLKKQSSNTEVTDGNNCYSFEGAEYGVYKEKSCSTLAGTLKTDKNGVSNELTLPAGTYYVKETKAPKGYALDTTIYDVAVTGGGALIEIKVYDNPAMNPLGIVLKKADADTGQSKPQGSATLKGAQFEVKYYKGSYDSDPEKSGGKAARTWILMTDEKGECRLEDSYFVSGDVFYRTASGQPALPLGTVTIQEILAPEGYLKNQEIYTIPVSIDGSGSETVKTYSAPTIPENVLELKIVKTIKDLEQPVPGVVFRHTLPDGSVEEVTTDQDGKTVLKGLTWGKHVIEEISVPDGIARNPGRAEFTVEKGNGITFGENTSVDESGRIMIHTQADGSLLMEVEDVLMPYELIVEKQNEKGKRLEGAEFTLYKDAECTEELKKAVSGTDGRLSFDGLDVGTRYYLKETKAPEGYRLPLDEDGNPVSYEIYTESNPVKGEFLYYVNGKTQTDISGTVDEREVNLTVVNHTGMKMPETGAWETAALTTAGLLAMAVALAFRSRKNAGRR